MSTKTLALAGLLAMLAGCDGAVIVERPHRRPPPTVVYEPAPAVVVAQPAPAGVYQPAPGAPAPVAEPGAVVAEPAPTYVEEGAAVNGVVVTEPVGVDYVFVGGAYYYWHPGLHVWVHAIRPRGWAPRAGVRVFHSWGEHPMYRR